MELEIEQRERDKIVILDLKGRLVKGDEELSLLQRLLFLLDSRRRRIILNLRELTSIDESGLETLAFSKTRFHDVGGRLVLLNAGQQHSQIVDLETYSDETDAVNSFFPDRAVRRYDILQFVKEQQLKDQESLS